MLQQKSERIPIRTQNDIVVVRQKVRLWALEIGFGLIDQTKVITAASELARNTLDYGGGGEVELAAVQNDLQKPGLKLVFEDKGPGISDISLALTDGYTTGGGLGMGLSGSRRLMNDFKLETEIGKGTRVTITKWK
ncbi:MAG: ATP-binding protein [Bdellovibrionota bacterium]